MHNNNSKIIAGILLILFGLFALSGNFLGLPYHFTHYLFSLPGLMMIIGLFILLNHQDSFLGVVLVGVGGFWFLSRFSSFPIRHLFYQYWPALLIVLGLYIILKKEHHPRINSEDDGNQAFDADYIDEATILGGGRKVFNSSNFKGGKVTSFLGGIHLDLHNSNLAEGTNVLEITAIFGGIDIVVPRDWKVIVNVTSIFGGFDDRRILNPNQVYEANKILIIRGTALFGGGHLNNY